MEDLKVTDYQHCDFRLNALGQFLLKKLTLKYMCDWLTLG